MLTFKPTVLNEKALGMPKSIVSWMIDSIYPISTAQPFYQLSLSGC